MDYEKVHKETLDNLQVRDMQIKEKEEYLSYYKRNLSYYKRKVEETEEEIKKLKNL